MPTSSRHPGYSAGRPSSRLAISAAAAVVIAALAGVALSTRHDDASALPTKGDESGTARFYADVKVAMVPLLRHVQLLQSVLIQVSGNPDRSPAVGALAGSWAEDMATTRDLVGRLIPPSGRDGRAAGSLFENGAALYRESALALSRLPDEPEFSARVALVRSAARLRLLADRVFDLGKQFVKVGRAGVETVLPEPVPVFAAVQDPCTAPGQDYSSLEENRPAIEWERWIGKHRTALAGAVKILDAEADPDALRATSGQLDGSVPEPISAAQGVIAVRLALLVDAEAACAQGGLQQRRLRVIGDDLWSLGARLVGPGPHGWPQGLYPQPTEFDPGALRTGGLFGGHPPPLREGDPPDLGVPGGLQLPDPMQVLGGP